MLDVEDRGLLYAEACFETFRVINGVIFNWREHEMRLRMGLDLFGLVLPGKLEYLCLEEAAKYGSDVLQRITVTGGNAPRGLLPERKRNVGVYIQSWLYETITEDIHLRTVMWPLPLYSRPCKLTADYAQTIRGLHNIKDRKMLAEGEEALICDTNMLYSAPTSNIFLFVEGVWLTPDADVVLPGVVRHALLKAGVARTCPCPHDLAARCEAIALTNSGWFVRPVTSINGRKLRTDGAPFDSLYSVLRGRAGVPPRLPCG
ncbi:MAG: aminotransferase class IV [Mariprofundaceae bacterium]|nr:aminotransferase class IV [Mariprofundaceae bacterium]